MEKKTLAEIVEQRKKEGKKSLADEYWDYANKKLVQTEELWGEIEARNEPWEESIQRWLIRKIDPEMSYRDYLVNIEHFTETFPGRCEEIRKKLIEGEKVDPTKDLLEIITLEELHYINSQDIWEGRMKNSTSDTKAIDKIKRHFEPGVAQLGDEIWQWSTPDAFWQAMSGRGGFAIIREGKVIETVTTVEN